MALHRWLGASFVIALAAAFAACSTTTQTTTGTTTTSSSGTGGAGIGGASTATSGTGGGVVDAGPIVCSAPPAFSTVPEGGCDILQQDCPAGRSCTPVQVGNDIATECVGGTGLKTAGEVCDADSDCDAKLFCIASKCAPVCCRDNDEPCNGGICDVNVKFGSYNVFFCHFAPRCELLTANACPTGLDCHIEDPKQGLATCSASNGTPSPELGPCMFINDCTNMQQCFLPDNSCHWYCDTAGSEEAPGLGGCPTGESCLSKFNGQGLGLGASGVGLCFLSGKPPPVDAGTDAGAGKDAGQGSGGSGGAGPGDAGAD